ncbi:MAG TPA: hypothetical protein VHY35_17715, partial [Stellaceae bacterium]|nr:hypothetical protein [Stellaceae bacterium]
MIDKVRSIAMISLGLQQEGAAVIAAPNASGNPRHAVRSPTRPVKPPAMAVGSSLSLQRRHFREDLASASRHPHPFYDAALCRRHLYLKNLAFGRAAFPDT